MVQIADRPAEAAPAVAIAAMGSRPMAQKSTVVPIRAAAAEAIEKHWRSLMREALEEAPFLSPDFILPAACHAPEADAPDLIAIWDGSGEDRTLVGLFPMKARLSARGEFSSPTRHAAFWLHPLQPFAAPLLAGPLDKAQRTVEAFLDWLAARPGFSLFESGALPVGSIAGRLLTEAAERRGLAISRRRGADLTRGLHFKPQGLRALVDSIAIASEPPALRTALERLLCLDGERPSSAAIALRDPMQPALLRAMVRSFARSGGALIALAEEAKAGALILVGRDRAYLWRLFGTGATDPAVEAALALAAERRLGLPIAAASTRPLGGAGMDAVPTENLSIGLGPEPASMASRMRLWIGSGLFG